MTKSKENIRKKFAYNYILSKYKWHQKYCKDCINARKQGKV